MGTDSEQIQIAFDEGGGFLRLTIEEASVLLLQLLSRETTVICGYPLSAAQKLELAQTIRELLPEGRLTLHLKPALQGSDSKQLGQVKVRHRLLARYGRQQTLLA